MESLINQIDLECKIELDRIDHICESSFSKCIIVCMESAEDYVYEASTEGFFGKVKAAIQKITKTISETAGKFASIISDKLKGIYAKITKKNIVHLKNEKVDVYRCEKDIDALNDYIRDMVKLERKLIATKVATQAVSSPSLKVSYTIGVTEIQDEIRKLDAKYDKVVSENSGIVKLALEDAIRFSDKQINNVKLNMDAIKKESDKVLDAFTKDINGCDIPQKANVIQKMSNAIGTKVRKLMKKYSSRATKTCNGIFSLIRDVAIAAGGAMLAKQAMKEVGAYGSAVNYANATGVTPPTPKEYAAKRAEEVKSSISSKVSNATAGVRQQVDAARREFDEEVAKARENANNQSK